MEYLTITIVPRSDGIYAYWTQKDTRAVRLGRPRSGQTHLRFFEVSGEVTEAQIATAVSEALCRLGRPS
jgi:hypothetical protein